MKYKRNMNLYSLTRPRLRQSWNKANLYNLFQFSKSPKAVPGKTFFQQKWAAKAATRAYHGDHIRERQWERMFSRRLPAVVEMDPQYLARFDGSEQASGRGSGREEGPGAGPRRRSTWTGRGTPYMHMTYAPMERRLDVAIFRALFASSTREARMFVVHGGVKVNGKKMVYPAYQLNPGDMFQVDIDRVMKATGKPHPKDPFLTKMAAAVDAGAIPPSERQPEPVIEYPIRPKMVKKPAKPAEPEKPPRRTKPAKPTKKAAAVTAAWSEDIAPDEFPSELIQEAPEPAPKPKPTPVPAETVWSPITNERWLQLADVIYRARKLAANSRSLPLARVTQNRVKTIRDLARYAFRRSYLVNAGPALMDGITQVIKQVEEQQGAKVLANKRLSSDPDAPASEEDQRRIQVIARYTYLQQEKALADKPVAEFEWVPKDYMSPFAFIPRYLEVNPQICAAVYLRHPVARQGQAEVPTPFPLPTSQLAFNWYLRRR